MVKSSQVVVVEYSCVGVELALVVMVECNVL